MNELRLARRETKRKGQGEGRTALPLKRRAERERIEQKTRGGDYVEIISTRLEDLPPLARRYVIENEGGMMLTAAEDRPVTPAEMAELEGQLDGMERERQADRRQLTAERDQRIAGEIDAKATSLMNSDPTLDYSSAMRRAIAEDGNFGRRDEAPVRRLGETHASDADMRDAVERRMKADPANYPDGEGRPVGSVHEMNPDDYQRQVTEAAQRRGYDL